MSAVRHATDANAEAMRLHLAIQGLCERSALGESITPEQVSALMRSSACVQFHTARALYATSQFAAPERRAPAAAPAGDIPTPLAALEVLLSECELTLDYRPSYRYAMSNAHCAIVNAKKPRQVLHGEVMLGERIELGGDEDQTFGDLFGEPDPNLVSLEVLKLTQRMSDATDRALAEVDRAMGVVRG